MPTFFAAVANIKQSIWAPIGNTVTATIGPFKRCQYLTLDGGILIHSNRKIPHTIQQNAYLGALYRIPHMDFEFRNFSTRSFERFAQAMALHVLGNGVLVFGDGPDGAREATYDGTLSYPTAKDGWSGYTVMQAKFLQVPGAPHEDADWLVSQLRAELDKFISPTSTLVNPEYYILVSNARLSPMPANERSAGGIAKIDAVFAEYKEKIGLKDYRVWHLDQLSTFLMSATELRRSYAAWLSSSDVISNMLESLHDKAISVRNSMYRYLTRELRSNQPLRLQQAGHSAETVTMIEDVFTDLPFSFAREGDRKKVSEKLLLASLLARSRDCLDGASIRAQHETDIGRPERILLLGGPGQGKSTLSQFLAQIFRANMLRSENKGRNATDIDRIIESTLSKAERVGLGTNLPRRFPLRVDLPSFADWLSAEGDDGEKCLLHYIATVITSIGGNVVKDEDLRQWISKYPTILILDGLDEVPPSANRSSVLLAINEFWDETPNADLLMVVTTRPQGYNDDLDPILYSKLEMTPLEPEQALAYAEKLAIARIPDRIQCDRVIARIREAAKSNTTTRLMVSPLQVAILLALIDQRGDAPTDRWGLFDKYFSVVLQREQGKTGPTGETMRHWGRQISAIHAKAGFLLHTEAETQGNSASYLSKNELEELIRGQLIADEFEGDELKTTTTELLDASTSRLVLLVQRAEDRFSFEVRSLQEFMAAAYLMTGRETIVQDRLKTIANRAHWLHVFQIAASKSFSENDTEHYRDTIITVCRDINENGEDIDRLLRTGSSLSLALLDDGLAYDQPKYRRMLLSTAFDLLFLGSERLPDTLSKHCEREPSRTTEHLRRYLCSTLGDTERAAWKLIFECHLQGQSWAKDLLEEIWPTDPEKVMSLFAFGTLIDGTIFQHKMRQALEQASPSNLKRTINNNLIIDTYRSARDALSSFPCTSLLIFNQEIIKYFPLRLDGLKTPVSFGISSIKLGKELRGAYEDLPKTSPWEPLRAVFDFHDNPSAVKLAGLLERAVDNETWENCLFDMTPNLPWPLATLLYSARNGGCFNQIARQLRDGEFGDIADWLAAEERWRTNGIVNADFEYLATGYFFSKEVATIGMPWALHRPTQSPKDRKLWIRSLLAHGLAARGAPRCRLRTLLEIILHPGVVRRSLSLDEALYLLEPSEDLHSKLRISTDVIINLPIRLLNDQLILDRLDKLGRSGRISARPRNYPRTELYRELANKIGTHPGLLVILVYLISVDLDNEHLALLQSIDLSRLLIDENTVVRGTAKVLAVIRGDQINENIKDILHAACQEDRSTVTNLLGNFLAEDRCNLDFRSEAFDAIAEAANQNPKFFPRGLTTLIQAYANGRRADLHEQDSWRKLDLGDFLLSFFTQRRMTIR